MIIKELGKIIQIVDNIIIHYAKVINKIKKNIKQNYYKYYKKLKYENSIIKINMILNKKQGLG